MPPVDDPLAQPWPLRREDAQLLQSLLHVERWGWLALAVLLPLALLGLLRSGPLSWAEALAPHGVLQVQYQRLPDQGRLSPMRVRTRTGQDGRLWLSLAGPLAERFSIEHIQPKPASVQTDAHGLRLRFETAPYDWLVIELILRPQGVGLASSSVGVGDQLASVTQLVLP